MQKFANHFYYNCICFRMGQFSKKAYFCVHSSFRREIPFLVVFLHFFSFTFISLLILLFPSSECSWCKHTFTITRLGNWNLLQLLAEFDWTTTMKIFSDFTIVSFFLLFVLVKICHDNQLNIPFLETFEVSICFSLMISYSFWCSLNRPTGPIQS